MEDLAPAAQGDQLAGCDAIDAGLAMTEAARLHGPRWGDPALSDVSWLGGTGSSISVADFYRAVWGGFVDRDRSTLLPQAIAGGEARGPGFDTWSTSLRPPRLLTITHGDFQVDNMMFSRHATRSGS